MHRSWAGNWFVGIPKAIMAPHAHTFSHMASTPTPTFDVPKPMVGLVFLLESVWVPNELTKGPLAGPGEFSP